MKKNRLRRRHRFTTTGWIVNERTHIPLSIRIARLQQIALIIWGPLTVEKIRAGMGIVNADSPAARALASTARWALTGMLGGRPLQHLTRATPPSAAIEAAKRAARAKANP